MSIVGPRPHPPDHYETDLKSGAVSAKYIKGGIMGLAQATKGDPKREKLYSNTPLDKDIKKFDAIVIIDNIYFQKYKKCPAIKFFLYDLKIVFRCFRVMLEAKGA